MPLPELHPVTMPCQNPWLSLILPGTPPKRRARFWELLAEGDAAVLAALNEGALEPYVYALLVQEDPPVTLPSALSEKLRHAYLCAVHLAARQEAEAVQVLGVLGEAGVEVILLKGADLRLRVYPDPATRPMVDLDILTSPEQMGLARAALRGLGYRPLEPEPRPGFQARFGHAGGWQPPAGRSLYVDLHWEIREGHGYYRLPYEMVQPRLKEVRFQNLNLKILAPEHLLIHLCLHTYFEFTQWRQLLDLALVCRRLPVNWAQLAAEVRAGGVQAPVSRVLELGRGLNTEPWPSLAALGLRGARPGWAERLVLSGAWGPITPYVAFFARQPRRDWLPYLSARLWPDREYLAAKFGSASRGRFLKQFIRKFREGGPGVDDRISR